MDKLERAETPAWLKPKWEEWGQDWQQNYQKEQKSRKFNWRQNQGKGYHDLLIGLSLMTQDHCSFCDAYPMGRIAKTIEHFRPKTRFPLLAYQWQNRFYAVAIARKKAVNLMIYY